MIGPVVHGPAIASRVMLVGQAPGVHEGEVGKPFGWTAGKRLFEWFAPLGVTEDEFRARVYIAAVCRCFPGKAKSGDRVPSRSEIENCAPWLEREIEIVRPELVIPVGRLAIEWFLPPAPLAEVIGKSHRATRGELALDVIPLPHPSGASTWFRMEPGATLLKRAMKLIGRHGAWIQMNRRQETGNRQRETDR